MNAVDPLSAGNAPRPLADDARFAVRDLIRQFEPRKAELLASAGRARAVDRATAGDCGDLVVLARRVGDLLKDKRDDLIQPYRDAAGVVRSNVAEFWEEIEEAIIRVESLADNFRAQEKSRIEKQQREQAAEQARIREANQPTPTDTVRVAPAIAAQAPRPIRGAYGARVGSARKTTIKVVDVLKVPLDILNSTKVHDAIVSVARDFAKHKDTIDGLEIERGEVTQIRGS